MHKPLFIYHSPVSPLVQFPFPFNALPPSLQETVQNVCGITQAPLDLIMNSVFGAISLACQRRIDVCPRDGMVLPTSLYFLTLAESGERKSSTDRLVMQPFHEHELSAAEAYTAAKKTYETEWLVWNAKRTAILSAIKRQTKRNESTTEEEARLLTHNASAPPLPKLHKMLYANVTIEALLQAMEGHGRSVGLMSDEGGNVLSRGVMQDLSSLNLLWDNTDLSVDRKTTENIRVIDGRLVFSIMLQEAVFQRFLKRQGNIPRGSGFFARCLPVRIDASTSTKGTRLLDDRLLHRQGLDRFHERIRELLVQQQGQERITLTFSREAKKYWHEYHNYFEEHLAPGGSYCEISDFASKMSNNIARLAGLFHYFTEGEDEIPPSMVERAFEICHWYTHQACRIFSSSHESHFVKLIADASSLQKWLLAYSYKKNTITIAKNEILQLGPSSVRNKESLEGALSYLGGQGCITSTQSETGKIFIHLTEKIYFST
ncbi:MAG: YfjI family protein [Serratia fonticola]